MATAMAFASSPQQQQQQQQQQQMSLNSAPNSQCSSYSVSPDLTSIPSDKKWITLNVGGKYFTTTRVTLSKAPNSFLHKLSIQTLNSQGLESDQDEKGAYLIDRDPLYFQVVLNYLRHGKLIMSCGLVEEGVLEEAEFYNILDLIKLVKQRIIDRNNSSYVNETKKHVYRVLQCHEDEVTQMVSTLSDGWRFEQIIKIRPKTGEYALGKQSEFLCVVSRDCSTQPQTNGNNKQEPNDRAKLIQQKATSSMPGATRD